MTRFRVARPGADANRRGLRRGSGRTRANQGRAASAGDLRPLVAERNRHRRAAGAALSVRQPPARHQSRRADVGGRLCHRAGAGRSRSRARRRDRHPRRPAGGSAPAIAAQRHRGRARAAVVARAAASVRGNPERDRGRLPPAPTARCRGARDFAAGAALVASLPRRPAQRGGAAGLCQAAEIRGDGRSACRTVGLDHRRRSAR